MCLEEITHSMSLGDMEGVLLCASFQPFSGFITHHRFSVLLAIFWRHVVFLGVHLLGFLVTKQQLTTTAAHFMSSPSSKGLVAIFGEKKRKKEREGFLSASLWRDKVRFHLDIMHGKERTSTGQITSPILVAQHS